MPKILSKRRFIPYKNRSTKVDLPIDYKNYKFINLHSLSTRNRTLKWKSKIPIRKYADFNLPLNWYYSRRYLWKVQPNPFEKKRIDYINNGSTSALDPIFNKLAEDSKDSKDSKGKLPNNFDLKEVQTPLQKQTFLYKYFFQSLTNKQKQAFDYLFEKDLLVDYIEQEDLEPFLFKENKMAYDLALRKFFVKLWGLTVTDESF